MSPPRPRLTRIRVVLVTASTILLLAAGGGWLMAGDGWAGPGDRAAGTHPDHPARAGQTSAGDGSATTGGEPGSPTVRPGGPAPPTTTSTTSPDHPGPGATPADRSGSDPAPGPGTLSPECGAPLDLEAGAQPAPPALVDALEAQLGDPRLIGNTVGVSVWVDGWGEVLAAEPDTPLLPASNQKIATAVAALARLGADHRFETRAVATAAPVAGVLTGDLVLVGGGDPTVTRTGPHSLDTLAAQIAGAGITRVTGDPVVDESRYATARAAPGWLDWQQPRFAGWLSALLVDQNRWQTEPADVAAPALANGRLFVEALARHGVVVEGSLRAGGAPDPGHVVAALASAPVRELVARLLTQSDNMIAESLVRELGFRAGPGGTHQAGTAVIGATLAELCVPVSGVDADGSGLSRQDLRSAREWRRVLQAARMETWWPDLYGGLPVGAATGTLRGRFGGTAGAQNVRAKTGQTIPARALSGYLTTAGGRDAVFSVVVNGEAPIDAEYAIDDLVATLAAWPG